MRNALLLCCAALLFFGCAKIVSPNGGEVDRTPPKQVGCNPPKNSLNFNQKEFSVEFDEYIVLDNVSQKLLVSPPLKVKPEVGAKLKKLYVKGLDSLQENTTYIFDFGDAIVDFNESNRLSNYKYSFSTGSYIDTLCYEGRVLEAFSFKPAASKYVLLFEDTVLTNFFDKECRYITKTDSSGHFSFSNLAGTTYGVLVLDDANQNRKYDLPTESVGFQSGGITPYVLDSATRENAKANVLYFEQFADKNQSILNSWFPTRGAFAIAFAKGVGEEFDFEFKNGISKEQILTEFSEARDTLRLYAKSLCALDTVEMKLSDGDFTDAISAVNNAANPKNKPSETFSFRALSKDTLHYFSLSCLSTPLPLRQESFDARIVKGNDTLSVRLSQKENLTCFGFSEDLEKGVGYKLIIDSAAAYNSVGTANEAFTYSFYLSKEEDYGRILLNYSDTSFIETPHVFYLLSEKGDVLQAKPAASGQGSLVFDRLKEGKYRIKAAVDENGDGKWTGADFSSARCAERVLLLEKVLSVRKSWDVEEDWNFFW